LAFDWRIGGYFSVFNACDASRRADGSRRKPTAQAQSNAAKRPRERCRIGVTRSLRKLADARAAFVDELERARVAHMVDQVAEAGARSVQLPPQRPLAHPAAGSDMRDVTRAGVQRLADVCADAVQQIGLRRQCDDTRHGLILEDPVQSRIARRQWLAQRLCFEAQQQHRRAELRHDAEVLAVDVRPPRPRSGQVHFERPRATTGQLRDRSAKHRRRVVRPIGHHLLPTGQTEAQHHVLAFVHQLEKRCVAEQRGVTHGRLERGQRMRRVASQIPDQVEVCQLRAPRRLETQLRNAAASGEPQHQRAAMGGRQATLAEVLFAHTETLQLGRHIDTRFARYLQKRPVRRADRHSWPIYARPPGRAAGNGGQKRSSFSSADTGFRSERHSASAWKTLGASTTAGPSSLR
jgi:hypothetical protein